jgi:hypothetical protein
VIDVLTEDGPYGTNHAVNNKKPLVVTDVFFIFGIIQLKKHIFAVGFPS